MLIGFLIAHDVGGGWGIGGDWDRVSIGEGLGASLGSWEGEGCWVRDGGGGKSFVEGLGKGRITRYATVVGGKVFDQGFGKGQWWVQNKGEAVFRSEEGAMGLTTVRGRGLCRGRWWWWGFTVVMGGVVVRVVVGGVVMRERRKTTKGEREKKKEKKYILLNDKNGL